MDEAAMTAPVLSAQKPNDSAACEGVVVTTTRSMSHWEMFRGGISRTLTRWFDSSCGYVQAARDNLPDHIDWGRILPFLLMHVACIGVIWVGISPAAVAVALVAYLVRMFAITGFYHRYFSHRTFKTSRPWQFVFGLLG